MFYSFRRIPCQRGYSVEITAPVERFNEVDHAALGVASPAIKNLLLCVDGKPVRAAAYWARLADIVVSRLGPVGEAAPRQFILDADGMSLRGPCRALWRPLSPHEAHRLPPTTSAIGAFLFKPESSGKRACRRLWHLAHSQMTARA
jgi:hypothetical protein